VACDTPEPSLFAHEILNAQPYAFLDDAPLEERRSHAVQTRRTADASRTIEHGALDAAAIARVREEERPDPRDADELHDALLTAGFLESDELAGVRPELLADLLASRRAGHVTFATAPGDAHSVRVAVERLPEWGAIHPGVAVDPSLRPPASRLARTWTREEAIVEIIRGRAALIGPTTAAALAASIGIAIADADAALLRLEAEGVLLRGRFTAGEPQLEWCDRTLLARIHRYTLNRLRADIEPVTPADFMRFLFRWQHVEPACRLTGIDGLREAIASLDGFELAASAWERAVLPARLDRYEPSMLDMLCLTGEAGWARFSPAPPPAGPAPSLVPSTPIALFPCDHADAWRALQPVADEPALGESARLVLSTLRSRGASFFRELPAATGLDADQVRHALGALVAGGLAVSDGFAGVRALVWAARGRPVSHDRRNTFAGRWTAAAASPAAVDRDDAVECQAWALLRRYGVIVRRLLTREANAASWRELARVYRRLEARGEIRGGRFVTGMSGEQFALPEAVEQLREVRRIPADGGLVTISAADPVNLTGIVTAGDRIRSAGRTRIVYRDGAPLAVVEGGVVRELAPIPPALAAAVSRALKTRGVAGAAALTTSS
jgi:ATP-dependent Lhr-like helicase